jgi:formylglycine-generating enzyme
MVTVEQAPSGSPCCGPSRPGGGAAATFAPSATPPKKRRPRAAGAMVAVPAGEFVMGTDEPIGSSGDGEGPARRVTVSPFQIDACALTNAQFAAFVRDTGHVTDAQRYGWSFVFYQLVSPEADREANAAVAGAPWWLAVRGATWRTPEGPGSGIGDRQSHPVVHVSWNDAAAYCAWAGKRLPTEAEWERATRGDLEGKRYPRGDEVRQGGAWRCNIWQGQFPARNTGDDGYLATAPVKAYRPNRLGLWNTVGNVWEWCADWFSPDFHVDGPRVDPAGPPGGVAKVIKGGSYLCHDSYCNRYRCAARSSNTPDSSTGNMGFRCASDA